MPKVYSQYVAYFQSQTAILLKKKSNVHVEYISFLPNKKLGGARKRNYTISLIKTPLGCTLAEIALLLAIISKLTRYWN